MTTPSAARAALDTYAVGHEPGAIGCRGFNRRDHAPAAFTALRAVLDLHARAPGYDWCMHCSGGEYTERWPCPTVRAVTGALPGDAPR